MSLVKSSKFNPQDVNALIHSVTWYHSVELLPGVITPGRGGRYNVEGQVAFIHNNSGGLLGKRILEIGAWDGPIAYKLKSIGYDVVASDIQNPEKTGFTVTGKITGIDVPYVRCSVYELPQYFKQEFDVVLFFGVFYHLKYPILAFERIAQVLKPGGRVLFMGSGVSHHFEALDGDKLSEEQCEDFRHILDKMDAAGVPICLSYPGSFLNGDNWFLPNRNALSGWMIAAGFKVGEVIGVPNSFGLLALSGWAERLDMNTVKEHGLVGEIGGYTSDFRV